MNAESAQNVELLKGKPSSPLETMSIAKILKTIYPILIHWIKRLINIMESNLRQTRQLFQSRFQRFQFEVRLAAMDWAVR